MKKSLALLAAATLGFASLAQAQVLQSRNPLHSGSRSGARITVSSGKSLRTATPSPKAEEMGALTLFLREDFVGMDKGTQDAPDLVNSIQAPEGVYKYPNWQNIQPEYTRFRGWGGLFEGLTLEASEGKGYTHSAGGAVHLGGPQASKINTPPLDLKEVLVHEEIPDAQDVVVLRFRMKAMHEIEADKYGVQFVVNAQETFWYQDGDSPEYDGNWFYPRALTPDITNISTDWQTYEMVFQGAGHSTLFLIGFQVFALSEEIAQAGGYSFDLLVDDIEVYKMKPFVRIPNVLPHSNFTAGSFDANWAPVEGATGYLLDVYQMVPDENAQPDRMGNRPLVRKDILKDQAVSGTTYTVSGIDQEGLYYYNVRAVNGAQQSYRSVDQKVYDLVPPTLHKAPAIPESGAFTASWDAVPGAERYYYIAYHERVAERNMEMDIINEDFTGVADADGNSTGYSVDNPSPGQSYTAMYPKDLNLPCWEMKNYMPYTDFVAFDGWQYIYGGAEAGMVSPELDLSNGNGVVNISLSLYGAYNEEEDRCPQAAIALFNYNEETKDFEQVELVYPSVVAKKPVTNTWQDYNVTLSQGSKRSIIGIYAVKGGDFLYVDNLRVWQNFKMDESYLAPAFGSFMHESTSIDVQLDPMQKEDAVYQRVKAHKADESGLIMSQFSPLQQLQEATAVNALPQLQEVRAYVQDNVLHVVNPNGDTVRVYDLSGNLLFSDNSGRTTVAFALRQAGAYIVRIGEVVLKVQR